MMTAASFGFHINSFIVLVTAILLAEAGATALQDDLKLDGGVYTPACLGQTYIDRLEAAGFHFDVKSIE